MSHDSVLLPPAESELSLLVESMCDGTILSEGRDQLEGLLEKDRNAQLFYIAYLDLHAQMQWMMRGVEEAAESDPSETVNQRDMAAVTDEIVLSISSTAPPGQSLPSSIFPLLSSTFHGTIGYSSGWPVAYLIATVITGLWLLSMWLMPVSRPEQVARQSDSLPSGHRPEGLVGGRGAGGEGSGPRSPVATSVGRITGMVDCKWKEKVAGGGWRVAGDVSQKSLVSLGDKFLLSSGLLEITYNTGAKVILQGPVTYEAEANGGYLSLGKLTGKLEHSFNREPAASVSVASKSEIRNQKAESSAFAVQTPTATVTDLGTEFGVEVGKDGITRTHVFIGEVQVVTGGRQHDTGRQTRVISAGQFAQVGRSEAISVGKEDAGETVKRFTRLMPALERQAAADAYAELVLSMNPVAYYRMEEWPKGKEENSYVLVDSAPGGHHGVLHEDRAFGPRCRGRFGSGLDLHGAGVEDYAFVQDYPKADNGQLSVSAWVWPVTLDPWASIVQNWSATPLGQVTGGQFYLGGGQSAELIVSIRQQDGRQVDVPEHGGQSLLRLRWQHVAFVADGAVLHLYRNGIEVGAAPQHGITGQPLLKGLSIGCQMDNSGTKLRPENSFLWNGRLDEIAVFNRALSPEQVRQLYRGSATEACPVAESPTGKGGIDKH